MRDYLGHGAYCNQTEFNRRVRGGARRGYKWLNASSVPLRPPRLFFLPESTGSQSGGQSTYPSSYVFTWIFRLSRFDQMPVQQTVSPHPRACSSPSKPKRRSRITFTSTLVLSRGLSRSTFRISRISPGLADNTTTRSAR